MGLEMTFAGYSVNSQCGSQNSGYWRLTDSFSVKADWGSSAMSLTFAAFEREGILFDYLSSVQVRVNADAWCTCRKRCGSQCGTMADNEGYERSYPGRDTFFPKC
jgi:hypothetical protein